MTDDSAPAARWDEPNGIAPRGTVIVLPGRGEQSAVYQRLGRRMAADGYRVRVLPDATAGMESVTAAAKAVFADDESPAPRVLVGSDTGALLALHLQATRTVVADGVVLAGLPDTGHSGPRNGVEWDAGDWETELTVRTSCPTHQAWISDEARLTRGALTNSRIPEALRGEIDASAVAVPVLGLHGAADEISLLASAREFFARLPHGQLVSIAEGKHDALNDSTHRIAAARIVLFVEELRGSVSVVEELPVRSEPVRSELLTAEPDPRQPATVSSVLITADELAEELASSNPPVVLDVRWALGDPDGDRHFIAGHVPGSVYVDLDVELASGPSTAQGRHPLPNPVLLQEAARRWGVRTGVGVVAYDDSGNLAAARAWWLLRWGGVPDVRLLDGGLHAWRERGHQIESGPAPEASNGDIVIKSGQLPVLNADEAAVFPDSGVLLDARSGERYRGETEPVDPRAGHIPGALSAPTGDNLAGDGRFLSTAELAERFRALGTEPGRPVAVYCGSGVTAAHEVAALAIAGIDAALYPGSWSQWSADPRRPVTTGSDPR
jgi:3-mercaptopyruvate sulfurtransferase SseA/alpha-beta hydrolase superfamily lysophospholipase